jgi:LPXTG-site transpeptidase (sortase) family protein
VVEYVPAPTNTPAPTATPSRQVASTKVVTKTRYRTVTKTQYREITRTTTRVKVRQVVKTVLRYRTVTQVKHVTVVRYRTRVVTRYRTVTRLVTTFRYLQDPKTGLLAHPPDSQGAPPVADTYISIPRLNITRAPVWNRGYVPNGDGTFKYEIVPAYGLTRFAQSARFGENGLTFTYGHDDLAGNIFRYLDTMRTGDIVSVYQGRHVYRYVVRLVRIVAPNDVTLLNATWTKPTLAMVSCWPFMVDTNRVVVIAQME